jgi:hypothetical protein
MFVGFVEYIRIEVVLFCVFVNVWGISFFLLRGKTSLFVPYTADSVLRDMQDALGDEATHRMRRLLSRKHVRKTDNTRITEDFLVNTRASREPHPDERR